MQVSVEINNDINCQMTVDVPKARFDEAVQERLKELAKKTRINGFRPGKVPVSVVKQRYGAQVRQEVMGEITQESFQDALEQESLRPANAPSIEFLNEEDDDKISYRAEFELYPKLELKIEGMSVKQQHAEVQDDDIDTMIEKLRKQRSEWQAVERASAKEDQVIIDFVGTLADETEPFEGGTAEDFSLVLGSKRLIDGFEDGLIGAKAGDKVELDLHFPESYQAEQLAGKAVRFSVSVKTVNEAILPEVNAEFIQAFGVESGEMDDFRVDVKDNMTRELSQALKQKRKQSTLDALLKNNEVNLPSSLVDAEAERMVYDMKSKLSAQGIDADSMSIGPEAFAERAAERVKLGLLLSEIISKHSMEAEPERVEAAIAELAATYEDASAVIEWVHNSPEQMQAIQSNVLEEQVVDWLQEQEGVTISTEDLSFNDIMGQHGEGV
jgi:trigger factor